MGPSRSEDDPTSCEPCGRPYAGWSCLTAPSTIRRPANSPSSAAALPPSSPRSDGTGAPRPDPILRHGRILYVDAIFLAKPMIAPVLTPGSPQALRAATIHSPTLTDRPSEAGRRLLSESLDLNSPHRERRILLFTNIQVVRSVLGPPGDNRQTGMVEKSAAVLRKCWEWVFAATALKPARRSSLIFAEQTFSGSPCSYMRLMTCCSRSGAVSNEGEPTCRRAEKPPSG